MNDKYIDTEFMHDANLREATARREQGRRPMPPELNDRLMRRIENRRHSCRKQLSVAACFVVVISIGVAVLPSGRKEQTTTTVAAVSRNTGILQQVDGRNGNGSQPAGTASKKHGNTRHSHGTLPEITTGTAAVGKDSGKGGQTTSATFPRIGGERLIRASAVLATDGADGKMSLVDESIADFAMSHGVKPVALDCSEPSDTNIVRTVYVFPDKEEVDIFGRLLQMACCYDNATSGYNLYISDIQLIFRICDMQEGADYLWLAERVDGSVLLYCSRSPVGTMVPSTCYQEFRERFSTQTIKSDNYHQL